LARLGLDGWVGVERARGGKYWERLVSGAAVDLRACTLSSRSRLEKGVVPGREAFGGDDRENFVNNGFIDQSLESWVGDMEVWS